MAHLRCTIHGNFEGCPGAFQCQGYLHPNVPADNGPVVSPEEAQAIARDARYVFGDDYDAWRSRLARSAEDKRKHEAERKATEDTAPTSGAV